MQKNNEMKKTLFLFLVCVSLTAASQPANILFDIDDLKASEYTLVIEEEGQIFFDLNPNTVTISKNDGNVYCITFELLYINENGEISKHVFNNVEKAIWTNKYWSVLIKLFDVDNPLIIELEQDWYKIKKLPIDVKVYPCGKY